MEGILTFQLRLAEAASPPDCLLHSCIISLLSVMAFGKIWSNKDDVVRYGKVTDFISDEL